MITSKRLKAVIVFKTLLVFGLLGPPIGSFTIVLLIAIVPPPSLMGLVSAKPIHNEIEHIIFLMLIGVPFSYKFAPLALLCGAVMSIARLLTTRSVLQITAATLTGPAVGVFLASKEVNSLSLSYRIIEGFMWVVTTEGVTWVVTCVVPSFCCAWLVRTRNPKSTGLG